MKKLSEFSVQQIKKAVQKSKSGSEVLRLLNVSKNGGNQRTLRKIIEENNISTKHFKNPFIKIPKIKQVCIICGKSIGKNSKFCGQTCYAEYNYQQNVQKWLKGELNGTSGNQFIKKFI